MGVAALPRPRKFAQMLALRLSARAASSFVLGNTRCSRGRRSRESIRVIPACSISRPAPVHRHRLPAMDRASCIPACAPLTVAAASALPLPRTSAQRMLIRTMPVHIQLMTMGIPPPFRTFG